MGNDIVNLQIFLSGVEMLQDKIKKLDSANSKFTLKEISYD